MSLKKLFSRLNKRLGIIHRASDLDDEMQFHLQMETAHNVAAGMPPEEARRRALIAFGGVQQTRESVRQAYWVRFGDLVRQDLGYALRMMRKNPLFTAVVIGVLTIGIGANTAIFSIIDVVLLKMLPIRNPEQLVSLSYTNDRGKDFSGFSYPAFQQIRDRNEVFTGVLAVDDGITNLQITLTALQGAGQSEEAAIELVSGTYFPVLGVDAVLGRTLTPDDDMVAGAHPLAVISYGYWKRRLALDPQVLGRTFIARHTVFTIVGVAPPGFFGTTVGQAPDMWLPLAMKDQLGDEPILNESSIFWLNILARLKPGMSQQQAAAAMVVLLKQVNAETLGPKAGKMELHAQVEPASKGFNVLRQRFSQPLRILMTVVGLVLLVACVSVASLLTARAVARQKEIALRITLGASNRRLLQQLLTESTLLASLSGLLGLLFTWWMGRALPAFLFEPGTSLALEINNRVLAFTIVVSILTGTLFGLAPAFQVLRSNLVHSLKDDPAGSGGLKRGFGFRRVLVVAQVALCMLLLMVAVLFVRSLQNLNSVDAGFNKENLLVVTVEPKDNLDPARLKNVYRDMLDRVQAVPGVRSCSVSVGSFADNGLTMGPVAVEGYVPRAGEDATIAADVISPGFFTTMGIPILLGRDFRLQDDATAPKLAIVNETFARYYFGNSSPLGKHLGWGRVDRSPLEIIGVVKDAKYGNLKEQTPRFLYLPFLQQSDSFAGAVRLLEVRTLADPAAVAKAVWDRVNSITSSLQVNRINTMVVQVQESLLQQSMLARLSSSFGLFALLLACMGLYGIMSHAVARRTNEIGVRMALGAPRSQVLWMMLREAMLLVAAGMAIGIPAALGGARMASSLISGLLFGVKAGEPQVIVASALIMGLVALLAGYFPSRRAAYIDPLTAIRHE